MRERRSIGIEFGAAQRPTDDQAVQRGRCRPRVRHNDRGRLACDHSFRGAPGLEGIADRVVAFRAPGAAITVSSSLVVYNFNAGDEPSAAIRKPSAISTAYQVLI